MGCEAAGSAWAQTHDREVKFWGNSHPWHCQLWRGALCTCISLSFPILLHFRLEL